YAALREKAASSRGRGLRRLAFPALAAVAVLGWALMLAIQAPEASSQGYRTAHGEQKEIALPDGSIVHLNTDSSLQVAFSGAERGVALSRGEAYFEVVKESGGRPFVVYARGTQVRVVGTKFNVRSREDGTDVIVSEGKVEVLPDPSRVSPSVPAKVELVPGNALRFDPVEQRVLIAAVDPERATAWRGGTIDFDNVPLEEMIAEVNRYTATPFAIVDNRIRRMKLSGTFRVGDADSVRFALRDGFGIEAIPRGDLVELRGPQ
ncbi:MAG TPA: FecR domain-containing protein, partial [Usitatibacter sp.]|nr:FecR domain-containing protein [Usitatibacter sp.]